MSAFREPATLLARVEELEIQNAALRVKALRADALEREILRLRGTRGGGILSRGIGALVVAFALVVGILAFGVFLRVCW